MKRFSLKAKLWLLSSSLIVLALLAATVTWYSSDQLSQIPEKVTGTEIPALRALGMADMYHDGLRGLAFQLAYEAGSESMANFESLRKELEESSNELSENMRKAGMVTISEEYQVAYTKVMPQIAQYLEALAQVGKREVMTSEASRAKALLAVNESFDVLEEALGSLGEIFEKESKNLEIETARIQKAATVLGLGTILFAAFFGVSFSYVTVRKIDRQLSHIVDSLTSQSRDLQDQVKGSTVTAVSFMTES